jgi:antitoxin (DNA-binding transcriptional repressor) of toxin-antitoxin stability system
MATFALEYAQEHLVELFHAARLGQEIVIMREDGKSCELTPLAEIPLREISVTEAETLEEPEAADGGLVPA